MWRSWRGVAYQWSASFTCSILVWHVLWRLLVLVLIARPEIRNTGVAWSDCNCVYCLVSEVFLLQILCSSWINCYIVVVIPLSELVYVSNTNLSASLSLYVMVSDFSVLFLFWSTEFSTWLSYVHITYFLNIISKSEWYVKDFCAILFMVYGAIVASNIAQGALVRCRSGTQLSSKNHLLISKPTLISLLNWFYKKVHSAIQWSWTNSVRLPDLVPFSGQEGCECLNLWQQFSPTRDLRNIKKMYSKGNAPK